METLFNPMTFPLLSLIIMSSINKFMNPIILGIMLMLFTLNIVIMTSKLIKYSILSYITFLMMIGGLLVIFLYFLSMSPKKSNMSFNMITMKTLFKPLTLMFLFSIMFMLSINDINNNLLSEIMNNNIVNFNNMSNNHPSYTDQSFCSLFYSMKSSTLIVISYLFMNMVIVVKMCINFNKPLRQMKKKYE